jgi:predicted transcriptional regulator
MGEEEALLENARTIYDHIVSHPGSHLRRISREVNIHLSTARYHLDHLERVGLITSRVAERKGTTSPRREGSWGS